MTRRHHHKRHNHPRDYPSISLHDPGITVASACEFHNPDRTSTGAVASVKESYGSGLASGSSSGLAPFVNGYRSTFSAMETMLYQPLKPMISTTPFSPKCSLAAWKLTSLTCRVF